MMEFGSQDEFMKEAKRRMEAAATTSERLFYEIIINAAVPWRNILRREIIEADIKVANEDADKKEIMFGLTADLLSATEQAFSAMMAQILLSLYRTEAAKVIGKELGESIGRQIIKDIDKVDNIIKTEFDSFIH